MTLGNIRKSPSRIHSYSYEPHRNPVKRYVQPTLFQPARTPEADRVGLVKPERFSCPFKRSIWWSGEFNLSDTIDELCSFSHEHTNILLLLALLFPVFVLVCDPSAPLFTSGCSAAATWAADPLRVTLLTSKVFQTALLALCALLLFSPFFKVTFVAFDVATSLPGCILAHSM